MLGLGLLRICGRATGKPALKRFTFDRLYTPKASQLGIYEDVKPLTLSVLDGCNSCVSALQRFYL